MKAQKNPTRRMLQNQCYDLLVASFNPKSKFYTSDCDELWVHLNTRSIEQLRETVARQNAINNVSEAEMRRNCQFEGLF